MRLKALLSLLLILPFAAQSQQYYPIKQDNKWGLIDSDGEVVVSAKYDAIGEFKHFGFAVMIREGGVGILNKKGAEVLPPKFQDLKILGSNLVAVMENGFWRVINFQEDTILEKGYEEVKVWDDQYLTFSIDQKWGIVNATGQALSAVAYDDIKLVKNHYFEVKKDKKTGLISDEGQMVLQPRYDEIQIYNPTLFFFRTGAKWGIYDRVSGEYVAEKFDRFSKVANNFISLIENGKSYLFSESYHAIITNKGMEDFFPIADNQVLFKLNNLMGMLDDCGNLVLAPKYSEIQTFSDGLFRANFGGKWGVVNTKDNVVLPFEFDYVAPLKGAVCVVIKNRMLGVSNKQGHILIPTDYSKIIVGDNGQLKAFQGEEMKVFNVSDEGMAVAEGPALKQHFTLSIGSKGNGDGYAFSNIDNDHVLQDYEWFYSAKKDRWGLRSLTDGSIQIEPTFDDIKVEKEFGFTVVGMEKFNYYDFEHTTYRFDKVYGLVNNEVGLTVSDIDFLDIRFDDFRKGYPVARCIFSNGRHGLINKIGKVIARDYAYIGDFQEGMARVSIRGRLSGSQPTKANNLGELKDYLFGLWSPNMLRDYTIYDRAFEEEAVLTCQDCKWGYLDFNGDLVVSDSYSFARDFVNEVGIVECDDKWGMLDREGKTLIPCDYDELGFLENTDNKIVKIYKQEQRYGLIDTLGKMNVRTLYEDIGKFSENRLSVKRAGLWGFVNKHGVEIIPCAYKDVKPFQEGYAAVKLDGKWGFIDKSGDMILPAQYARVGFHGNGLIPVSNGGAFGYVNLDGEMVIDAKFDRGFSFKNGIAKVEREGKIGFIDTQGDYIVKPRFISASQFNEYGFAIVTFGTDKIRVGLINREGAMITNTPYRYIGKFSEGYAAVRTKDGFGFIDTLGRLAIKGDFDQVGAFHNGRAMVKRAGRCGYIDITGTEIIEPNFNKCLDFDDGKAVVYKNMKKAGLIDVNGEFLIRPSINKMYGFSGERGIVRDTNALFMYIAEGARNYDGHYQKAKPFEHGVAVVQVDGKWGIINQKGIKVVPPKYDKIEDFVGGHAKVRIQGLNGLTDLTGKLIVQPDYEYISYAGDGVFRVERGDEIGYFDMGGDWVWGLSK